jgi:PKD repeat protein
MKSKAVSTFFTVVLFGFFASTILSSATISVNAQATPSLKLEPDFYFARQLNEEFNVNVTIYNIEESMRLVAIHFRLYYDPKLLQVVNVYEGEFLPKFNQTPTPPATLFVWFTESDGIFGPHIVLGTMLFPNSTGQWPGPFPEGDGTVAIIRFKVIYRPVEPNPIAVCVLRFLEVKLVDDQSNIIDCSTGISLYQSPVPLLYPRPQFTYSPAYPSAGQAVLFDASQSRDPDGTVVSYVWDFGDGATLTTSEKKVTHIFAQPKTYNVTLKVVDSDGLAASTWKLVDVGVYTSIDIKVEAGKLYYRGEKAEFYISTSQLGKPINVLFTKLLLYYNGSLYADLGSMVQPVDDGLYMISYNIPEDAEIGVYLLLVEAEYSGITGIGTASFQISSLFEAINATLVDINGAVAYINSTLGILVKNVTDIKATLVGIDGTVAYINSTLGKLYVPIQNINATLVRLSGAVAYINSTVGSLVAPIQKINLTVTEIKRDMATGQTVATIQTTLGTIKGYIENVDDGGLATINTEIGTVKTNVSTLLQRVPEKPPTVDMTPSWIAAIFAILAFVAVIFLVLRQR